MSKDHFLTYSPLASTSEFRPGLSPTLPSFILKNLPFIKAAFSPDRCYNKNAAFPMIKAQGATATVVDASGNDQKLRLSSTFGPRHDAAADYASRQSDTATR